MATRPGTTLRWLLLALVVWGAGTLYSRLQNPPPVAPPAPAWQRSIAELSATQQQFHDLLRARLGAAERERSQSKRWPPAEDLFPRGWVQRRQRSTINYVGEGEGLRWLVLFLEPDPRAPPEKAPPEDDEHHTLADGTPLHVTLWTQPLTEPPTDQVTAFPAAEGWVERVRR